MRAWITAVLLSLSSAAAFAGTPLPDAPHVVVQGEGLVSVAPDSATVSMVARHRSMDAGEAKRVVDGAVEALLKAAPGFDVAKESSLRKDARERAVADAREKAAGLAVAFGGGLGPVYSINSLNSMQSDGYGSTTLDRIEVTGTRMDSGGRYLQPKIDFTERVSAVFEISR